MPSALASLQSKVRLSPGEKRLLALLPASGKRINTLELTKLYYARRPEPFNGRIVVVGMVKTLQKKIKTVKQPPFYIHNSERAGPIPMEVWREKRVTVSRLSV